MLGRYFSRRFRLHYASMFIPTLIIFLLIGAIMISHEQSSLKEVSASCLENFDESLQSSLYNMGYQIDSMTANASFSLSLKKILSSDRLKLGESSVFSMIKNFFRSYEISYSYIHSIYLYIDGKSRFLSTTAGYVAGIDGYFDREWLTEYQQMDPEDKLFTTSRQIARSSFEAPVDVLSLYYRLSYVDGVIVINVDADEYGRFLQNLLIDDLQQVFLFNSKGACLGVCGEKGYISPSDPAAAALSEDSGPDALPALSGKWKKAGGSRYYLYSKHSGYVNIDLVSACPLHILMERILPFLWVALLVLLLDAVVMFILAYRYTRQSFDFIELYIDIFSAAERGEYIEKPIAAENDEYGLILNNIIYLYLNNNRMQMELQDKEHQKTLAEMASLQMQINPHFIFNTLQIMDFDVLRQMGPSSQIHRMIGQLSNVVKYALSDPMEEVTLRTEMDYLKAYLEIQNIRFDNGGIIYFEADESVYDLPVFRLLLQPVLENCFEHGMYTDGRRIAIKVKLFDRGDHLAVSVTDNGKGMSKEELAEVRERIKSKNARSIGLVNLNRRLILHYGEESALHILSRQGMGTVICFKIPLDQHKK